MRRTPENEYFKVITIFEEGINKQDVRRLSPYSKRHGVLVYSRGEWEWR
ncbi:MAG: hypothetical protein ACE3JK_01775 [Sporolactobacillus sp.]